jgi:hypothetical protein
MRFMHKVPALFGVALSLAFSSGCCCWCQPRSAPYYYSAPASSCYQPPVCSTASNEPIRPVPMPARPADSVTR